LLLLFVSFHSEGSEEPALAFAVAFAFLVVIPQGSASSTTTNFAKLSSLPELA
jgi:hypothetical protein